MARTNLTVANEGNWANLVTGESHVLLASLGLAATGIGLILYGWSKNDWRILFAGLVVLVSAVGIATDIWAHSYQH